MHGVREDGCLRQAQELEDGGLLQQRVLWLRCLAIEVKQRITVGEARILGLILQPTNVILGDRVRSHRAAPREIVVLVQETPIEQEPHRVVPGLGLPTTTEKQAPQEDVAILHLAERGEAQLRAPLSERLAALRLVRDCELHKATRSALPEFIRELLAEVRELQRQKAVCRQLRRRRREAGALQRGRIQPESPGRLLVLQDARGYFEAIAHCRLKDIGLAPLAEEAT